MYNMGTLLNGLPRWLTGKESIWQCRGHQRHGFNFCVGKIPRRRIWQHQYYCLENPMDRGTWRATVHGVAKSWTWLNNWALTHFPQYSITTYIGKESEKEWIYVYVKLNHFTLHLKLMQPWIKYNIKKILKYLSLIVLEVYKSKIKGPTDSLSGETLLPGSYLVERVRDLSGTSFTKPQISSIRTPP